MEDETVKIIIYALFSGITIFFGGLLALLFEKIPKWNMKEDVLHTSIAFGGGVLVAAVAFVLTPRGIRMFPIEKFTVIFLAGAGTFFLIDRYLEQKGGAFAQALAMMMDYVPEAIALGAVLAHDHQTGLLLALFIGLQNFPESFNAYSDLRANGFGALKILLIFIPLSLIGVGGALLGNYFFIDRPELISGLMLFSAGGILYLIFQDIAPLSKVKQHWGPALGATVGFVIGMIGTKVLG